MKPFNVVYFTDSSTLGGAEQVLLSTISNLDRTLWSPTLLHHDEPGLSPLLQELQRMGVQLHVVPKIMGTALPIFLARFADFVSLLIRQRPSVFHAHLSWPMACQHQLVAACLAQVPAVVASEHSLWIIGKRRMVLQHKLVSLGVHRFIVVSNSLAQRLRTTLDIPERKIRVVHNGIAVDAFARRPPNPRLRFSLTPCSTAPIVICVARLHEQKGLRYLLEAAVSVPGATFALVGDGPERENLQRLASTLRIDDRVVFLGERHDIGDLLSVSDLFVLPSLNEAFPLSVLEAMASETPIVATAVGGIAEAVVNRDSAILVPPADSEALALAIQEILSIPGLARQLVGAAKSRVLNDFTVQAMVSGTTRIYEEVLGNRMRQN